MTSGDSAVLALRGEAVLFINTSAPLAPFAAHSPGLCIRRLILSCTTQKSTKFLIFDSIGDNAEPTSPVLSWVCLCAGRCLIPLPAPTSSLFPLPARRQVRPLACSAADWRPGWESPPRAYVRVRAVRAHLAFELRRFWLPFTSLPAFSARCSAKQGSSGKATGGGSTATEARGEKGTREGEGAE